MSIKTQRRNIAVLGGGAGAMAAAFALTSAAGWRDQYDVTVYQTGWRLGGKGASGRNAMHGQRIEEHGLHVWMGCYNNAFRTMQDCYAELARPASAPLATWDAAFVRQDLFTMMENVDGEWRPWSIEFPRNAALPGQGGLLLPPWDYLKMLLDWMVRGLEGSASALAAHDAAAPAGTPAASPEVERALAELRGSGEDDATHLHLAHRLAHALGADATLHAVEHHLALAHLLTSFDRRLGAGLGTVAGADHTLRRLWTLLRLGVAAARGMLTDGLLFHGVAHVDDMDFREWLRKHGAGDAAESPVVEALYDLCFAYEGGHFDRPNFAAGTALWTVFLLLFAYKGAFGWKMTAGMGDVVFAPLYQVLRQRGVRFEFFHRVAGLGVSDDGARIETIDVDVQATITDAARSAHGEYQPLVDVLGLPCWPSEPLYDQLVEGADLKDGRINLESSWTPWKRPDARRTLRRGQDFDLVVLGISVGALEHLCPELIRKDSRWAAMVANVKTVQTQALQLWLHKESKALGWKGDEREIASTYVHPFESYADMTQVLDRETWPATDGVCGIAYFCCAMEDAPVIPAPFTDPGFPVAQLERVKSDALRFVSGHLLPLWPKAADPARPDRFDWRLLVDPKQGVGADRLDRQYVRANIDPSERYVLSVKGSTRHRLRPDQSGFDNLFLAGDWTLTDINAGCVESAVMSGLRAAIGARQSLGLRVDGIPLTRE